MNASARQNGFALITVLMLLALLMTLAVGYFTLTRIELSTTRSSMDSFRGFYAAEGGLNVRADLVRSIFVDYNRPAGTAPSSTDPCSAGNLGSGDFACATYALENRSVQTYVEEDSANPTQMIIPRGEPFQNLNAQEYRYAVYSRALNASNLPEAVLEMHFKSRLVPMFQFAAFYNKDLEILPGQNMTLAGPVHTNGDLYVNSSAALSVLGQVTSGGTIYRGRKNANTCDAGPVNVLDPENPAALPACAGGSRRTYVQNDFTPWNGMVQLGTDTLTVPTPDALDPVSGSAYWDLADLRIMLDLNAGGAIQIRDAGHSIQAVDTGALLGCTGAVAHTNTFYNERESDDIEMLDVDLEALLDCIHANSLMGGKALDDATQGGLVVYLGVDGPNAATINDYGVRVRNGAEIAASAVGAPAVRGLTIVTNQAIYVQGDYNDVNKKPAAFLADSLNVLSNNWTDVPAGTPVSSTSRVATTTTINAAFLAGTDSTGGAEGAAGQDSGVYNGGLENYPRLHEYWSGRTLRYRGSFVSLNAPRHVDGAWVYGSPQYTAPTRDWGFDTDFADASKLPPLSPRFVYLRQELFVRRFEL